MQCSSGFSAMGAAAPTAPLWLRHCDEDVLLTCPPPGSNSIQQLVHGADDNGTVCWLCVFICLSQWCFSRVCSVIFFCMYSLPWRQTGTVQYVCFNERQQAHTCVSHLLTSFWKLWIWPCLIVCVCLRVRVHVRVSGISLVVCMLSINLKWRQLFFVMNVSTRQTESVNCLVSPETTCWCNCILSFKMRVSEPACVFSGRLM